MELMNQLVTLNIRGMTCASCVARLEKSLSKVAGVDAASVNLATEKAQIRVNQEPQVITSLLIAAVEKAGFEVEKLLSGPYGGDAQIAALAAEKKLAAVIFFRDPLDKHPHEPDVQMLMRICDVHNIPLATNPASAGLLFKALTQTYGT